MLVPVFASLYENYERALYSVMHMIRISEVTSNHGEPILASPEVTLVHRPSKDRKRSRPAAPGQVRRELEEQKLLLKDPNHIRTVQRWVKPPLSSRPSGHGGRSIPRVRSIKFGAKLIEFEKGKAGIVVQSKDKLAGVIEGGGSSPPTVDLAYLSKAP